MKRFVEGADRAQSTLLPECLDDWIDEENPVRAIDVFVDALDLGILGFDGVEPAAAGRPAYLPSVLLKLHIYGYVNRVQSSRRLSAAMRPQQRFPNDVIEMRWHRSQAPLFEGSLHVRPWKDLEGRAWRSVPTSR